MTQAMIELTSATAAVLAALAAIFSGFCALLSYLLSRKIKQELESDERIIASSLDHPGLQQPDHNSCVLRCALFNKSKRKSYVNSVNAYDRSGNKLEITWSNEIDLYGNPQNPSNLLGIIDTVNLYVRRNGGERISDFLKLEISHSFSDTPLTVVYEPFAGWE